MFISLLSLSLVYRLREYIETAQRFLEENIFKTYYSLLYINNGEKSLNVTKIHNI